MYGYENAAGVPGPPHPIGTCFSSSSSSLAQIQKLLQSRRAHSCIQPSGVLSSNVEQRERRTSPTRSKYMRLTRHRGLLGGMVPNASPRMVDGFAHLLRKEKKLHYFPFFCSSQRSEPLFHRPINNWTNCKESRHLSAAQTCICTVGGWSIYVSISVSSYVLFLLLQSHFYVFNFYQMQSMTQHLQGNIETFMLYDKGFYLMSKARIHNLVSLSSMLALSATVSLTRAHVLWKYVNDTLPAEDPLLVIFAVQVNTGGEQESPWGMFQVHICLLSASVQNTKEDPPKTAKTCSLSTTAPMVGAFPGRWIRRTEKGTTWNKRVNSSAVITPRWRHVIHKMRPRET